jgi:hypothetical protein
MHTHIKAYNNMRARHDSLSMGNVSNNAIIILTRLY